MCIGYIAKFVPIKIADNNSKHGSQDASDVDLLLKLNAEGMTNVNVKKETRNNGFRLRGHVVSDRPIFNDLHWQLLFIVLSRIKSSLRTQYHFR